MFQVLVQYLATDIYASFYVDKAIDDYHELLKKVTTVIVNLKQLQAEQVKLAYKDLQLGSYINIDPAECSHVFLLCPYVPFPAVFATDDSSKKWIVDGSIPDINIM